MFGFGKKKNQDKKDKKKRSKIDKLIMGAIVGGAVGSVIGMSIAPQKGKETRELIAQKGKDLLKKGHDLKEGIKNEIKNNDKETTGPQAIEEAKNHKKGLFSKISDRFLKPGKKVKKGILKDEDLKKIPNEVD